jgi:sporulation protein YabP
MENNKPRSEHSIELTARNSLKVSGVDQIISFDENSVILSSSLGELEISGYDLNVDALDLDKGFASLSGEICGINYIDEQMKKKTRFWGRR